MITSSATWSGRVRLTGDVTIKGGTITIAPGTVVESDPVVDDQIDGQHTSRIELVVDGGALVAEGTAPAPIRFTSARATGQREDWHGIRVRSGSASFKHCLVEYGFNGLWVQGGQPTIEQSVFQQNSLAGVSLESSASFTGCIFRNNGGPGLTSSSAGRVTITSSSSMHNAGQGLILREALVNNSTISSNASTGISASSGTLILENSTVSDNQGDGVNVGSATFRSRESTFFGNQSHGINAAHSSLSLSNLNVSLNVGSGLYAIYGNLDLKNSTVSENRGHGVVGGNATFVMANTTVRRNGASGISVSGAPIELTDSIITDNATTGITASVVPDDVISGNRISGNGVGVSLSASATYTGLTGNDIFANSDYELSNAGPTAIIGDGNYWGEPTSGELGQRKSNLTKIQDSRDESTRGQVTIRLYSSTSHADGASYVAVPSATSDTVFSGLIDRSMTWSGRIRLIGDVTIKSGTVTIAPGTIVESEPVVDDQVGGQHASRIELVVEGGTLVAEGTAAAPIRFTSARATGQREDWHGIRVRSGSGSFKHCIVEYGFNGLWVQGGQPTLEQSVFQQNSLAGVNLESSASFLGCTFRNNGGAGLTSSSAGRVMITASSSLHNTGQGLILREALVSDSTISSNASTGISASSGALTLENSTVNANGGDGVNVGSAALHARASTILGNQSHGINAAHSSLSLSNLNVSLNIGSGLYAIYGSLDLKNSTVTENRGHGVVGGNATFVMANTTVRGNGASGVSVSGAPIELTDSIITDNATIGIAASVVPDDVITGNRISGNGVGVGLSASATYTGLTGNDIFANSDYELSNAGQNAIIADRNYWGEPTTGELVQRKSNLTKIEDSRDTANRGQVEIREYTPSSHREGANYVPVGGGDSDTVFSGIIERSLNWSGRIRLTGDVILKSGTITIAPGTIVESEPVVDDQVAGQHTSRIELVVEGGALIAEGTAEAPIRFTSARPTGQREDWHGIRVRSGSASFKHCVVEYGFNGLWVQGAQPTIEESIFERNSFAGVNLESSASFIGCTFRNNGGAGLSSSSPGRVTIISSRSVHNTGQGMSLREAVVNNCTISSNASTGITASSGTLTLENSTVSANQGDGVNAGSAVLHARGSAILGNQSHGINAAHSSLSLSNLNVSLNIGSGLYAIYGNLDLKNSTVTENSGHGVVGGNATFVMANTTVRGNGASGVSVSGAPIELTDSMITDNGTIGISASVAPDDVITGNRISGNGVGVSLSASATYTGLAGNDIFANSDYELSNAGSSAIIADGNYWGEPTSGELSQRKSNLIKIQDSRDESTRGQVEVRLYSTTSHSEGANYISVGGAGSDTVFSGTIDSSMTWSGRIRLTGDLIIRNGTVTITPGTVIDCEPVSDDQVSGHHSSRIELVVDGGTLIAEGTAASPIRFTSARATGQREDWHGIRVRSGSASFKHCIVEYGFNGLWVQGGQPTIERSLFQQNSLAGVNSESSASFSGCIFRNNGGPGLTSSSAGRVTITSSSSMNNTGQGLILREALVNNCTISSNAATGVSAASGTLTLENSTVSANQGDGVNAGSAALHVRASTILGNQSHGINAAHSSLSLSNLNVSLNVGSGLYAIYGNLDLKDSTVTENRGHGVVGGNAAFVMANTTVRANGVSGVSVSGAPITLTDSIIADNATDGLTASVVPEDFITGNRISGNGVGVSLSASATYTGLTGNDIFANSDFELRNTGSSAIIADGNYWGDPTTAQLLAKVSNLTKIHDSRDGGPAQVAIRAYSTIPLVVIAPTYAVNLFASPPNAGIVIGARSYLANSSVTVSATPNSGYTFQNWSDEGQVVSSSADYTFALVTNRTLVANFAAIDLGAAPTVRTQPISRTANSGASIIFTVVADGAAPLSYQWRKGGADLPGKTTDSLRIDNVQAADAGSYSVRVSNAAGSVVSQSAILAVNAAVQVKFARASMEVSETAQETVVALEKIGSEAASVNVILSGTAEAGRDYRLQAGTLTFAAGTESREIAVTILNDYIYDGPKQLTLDLEAASPGILGTPNRLTIQINDDEVQTTPSLFAKLIPPAERINLGAIQVTLTPPGAADHGGWRFPWELYWHTSGKPLTDLDPGEYPVEFKPIANYREPAPDIVPVLPQAEPTFRTVTYALDESRPVGKLRVHLDPPEALVGFPSHWRLQGDAIYFNSGEELTVPTGTNHILEFRPVPGWLAPRTRVITVHTNSENVISLRYSPLPSPPAGARFPNVIPTFAEIEDGLNETLKRPLPLMGQLRTTTGFGSGVAVQKRVVLTAAHVLLDETGTNFVNEVNWSFQRHAGEYDPRPIQAAGWYVREEFLAARRQEKLSLHLSTPSSRQWDVAAIYFDEDISRGGQAGYLLSDLDQNEWLANPTREKFLAGYPLTGQHDGKLHAIDARRYLFARQSGRVFQSYGFLSYEGNSGGPLCVLAQIDGHQIFFPAGVYLGFLDGLSVVRAIDSDVAQLIARAASHAEVGTNFVGGGAVHFGLGRGSRSSQYLTVRLSPADAVSAGAGWRRRGTSQFFTVLQASEQLDRDVEYTIEFREIPGWNAPAPQMVKLTEGQNVVLNVTYAKSASDLPEVRVSRGPQGELNISWTNGGTLQSSPSLTAPNWTDLNSSGTYTGQPSGTKAFFRVRK